MPVDKPYTDKDVKKHPLVKLAIARGFTNVKIINNGAMSFRSHTRGSHTRGWVLECTEHPWVKIGYDAKSAKEALSKL